MKPSKVGRSRTDAESLIEMMATVGLDASDLTAFRDMNSTDFSMGNNWGGGYRPVADFARSRKTQQVMRRYQKKNGVGIRYASKSCVSSCSEKPKVLAALSGMGPI